MENEFGLTDAPLVALENELLGVSDHIAALVTLSEYIQGCPKLPEILNRKE